MGDQQPGDAVIKVIKGDPIEILDRFRHTGFSVFPGPPVLLGDTAARKKLAVYIARAPISLDRLSYDGPNGTADYRPKSLPGHPPFGDDAPHQDRLEVLAVNTNHIPNTSQQLVCYLSWCSNKITSRCQFPVIAETDA